MRLLATLLQKATSLARNACATPAVALGLALLTMGCQEIWS